MNNAKLLWLTPRQRNGKSQSRTVGGVLEEGAPRY